ncbi:unnamed protein product [Phytomonas sp. EM1]|nr:unnamed protein product [Phytomonas sp. EM1]|eukprot:CCW64460.1 unnamed protein product [Phytomonas sp. isolate EM1]
MLDPISVEAPEDNNLPSVEYFEGDPSDPSPDANLNHIGNNSFSLLSVVEIDGAEVNGPEDQVEEKNGVRIDIRDHERTASLMRSGSEKVNSSERAFSNSAVSHINKPEDNSGNTWPESNDPATLRKIISAPLLHSSTLQSFFFLVCCYAQEHFRGRLYYPTAPCTLLGKEPTSEEHVNHPVETPENNLKGPGLEEAVKTATDGCHSITQREEKFFLDPLSTSLFNNTLCDAGRENAFWVRPEKNWIEKPASPCRSTEEDGAQDKQKRSENKTKDSHMSRLSCCGNAAVGEYFQAEIQTCYAIEDALRRFLRADENRRSTEAVANYSAPGDAPEGGGASETYLPGTADRPKVKSFEGWLDQNPLVSSSETIDNKIDHSTTTTFVSPCPTSLDYFKQHIVTLWREQLQKRYSEQESEDNRRSFMRMQELPYLVTDAVHYALLLTQLQSASPLPAGLSGWRPVSGLCDCAQLPYYRYPPPLFRTSSFAGETTRLLGWLRTWRPPAEAPTAAGFTENSNSRNRSKENAPRGNTKSHASMVGESQGENLGNIKVASPPSITQLKKEGSCSIETEAGISMTDRRKSRLRLSTNTTVTKAEEQLSIANETRLNGGDDGGKIPGKGPRRAVPKRFMLDSSPDGCRPTRKLPKTEEQMPECGMATCESSPILSTPSVPPQPHRVPAQEAYKRYCRLWQDTSYEARPSQRISGGLAHNCPEPPLRSVAAPSVAQSASSRVCASLPFSKEIRREEETTALGTICGTYVDAFGSRLRSARLARLEAERLAQKRLISQKRSKRRGYFTRDDTEEDIDLLGRITTGPILNDFPLALQQQKHQCTLQYESGVTGPSMSHDKMADRSSRCLSSSSSSPETLSSNEDSENDLDDGITNIAVLSGPTGSGKTASVYLAAELLGFQVVEMNTSVQRSAKSVEHLLAELTRSHRLYRSKHGKSTVSIEEELNKLKREHAIMMKARVDQAAAARLGKRKASDKRRANGISAQAVASFFGRKTPKNDKENSEMEAKSTAASQSTSRDTTKKLSAPSVISSTSKVVNSVATGQSENTHTPGVMEDNCASDLNNRSGKRTSSATLLLIEDADILLGNEASKPFYAAIRDLAKKSKVPLVVTVSTDPLSAGLGQPLYKEDAFGSNRYDLEESSMRLFSMLHPKDNGKGSVPDARNHNDALADLTEAQNYLYGDGNAVEQTSENNQSNGCGFVRVAMSAALVAQYFGKQTPFMTLQPMSKAALFTELLVIGAVELGLIKVHRADASTGNENLPGNDRAGLPKSREAYLATQMESVGNDCVDGDSKSPVSTEKGNISQEYSLELCDVERFKELSARLREEIYGRDVSQLICSPSCSENHPYLTAASAVAATKMFSNTDIRYWLNRLHWLLLDSRTEAATPAVGKEALKANAQTVAECVNHIGSDSSLNTIGHVSNAAEIVQKAFLRLPWQEATAWDALYGRYQAAVSYNELHCPRQERWSRQHLVTCSAADILTELNTCDVPFQSQVTQEVLISASHSSSSPQLFPSGSPASPAASFSSDLSAASTSFATVPIVSAAEEVASKAPGNAVYGGATFLSQSTEKCSPDLVGLKPVDAFLPYGDAQRWLQVLNDCNLSGTGAQTASCIPSLPPRPFSVTASSLLVGGHFEEICRPQISIPITIAPTTKQRANALEAWWKRTRKREAIKNYVVGRSAHVCEDLLGVSSLLTPSTNTMPTTSIL